MRPDIRPGTAFRDYELPDHTGRRRRLSEIQGDHPMIIVGPRGLIGQGAGAARGPRGAVAGHEARGRLLPHGDNHDHGPTAGAELLKRRRGGLAVPGRSRPERAARSGDRRLHRPGARPDGPAHDRVRALADRLQGLHRLRVLRAPHRRGTTPGHARGAHEAPLGLGSLGPRGQAWERREIDRFYPPELGLAPGGARSVWSLAVAPPSTPNAATREAVARRDVLPQSCDGRASMPAVDSISTAARAANAQPKTRTPLRSQISGAAAKA
jgi:hypothetical protein